MIRFIYFFLAFVIVSCSKTPSEQPFLATDLVDTPLVAVKNAKIIYSDIDSSFSLISTFKKEQLKQKGESLANFSVDYFLKQLDTSAVYEIRICNNKEVTVTLPKGTKLFIQPNTFSTEEGVSSDSVTLQAREFYSLADIVSANLTTTTEREILETGGMIFLHALDKGKACGIRDGKLIEVHFPFNVSKSGMQLFTGKKNGSEGMIWEQSFIEKEVNESDLIVSIIEKAPEFPGGFEGLQKHLSKKLSYPADARRLGISGIVYVQFAIDESGHVIKPSVLKGVYKSLDEAAVKAISSMPEWKPAQKDGKNVSVSMTYPIRFSLDGSVSGTAPNGFNLYTYEELKTFKQTMTDSTLKTASAADVSCYILQTSKLGWLNCDRFINQKSNLTFQVEIDDPTDVAVKLIFKDIRSFLSANKVGNSFYFSNIPNNTNAYLLALRTRNGVLEMMTKEVTIKSNTKDFLSEFEPITVSKLHDYLNKIDNQ